MQEDLFFVILPALNSRIKCVYPSLYNTSEAFDTLLRIKEKCNGFPLKDVLQS